MTVIHGEKGGAFCDAFKLIYKFKYKYKMTQTMYLMIK